MTHHKGKSILEDLRAEIRSRAEKPPTHGQTVDEVQIAFKHGERILDAVQLILKIRKLKTEFDKEFSNIEKARSTYDSKDIVDVIEGTKARYNWKVDNLVISFFPPESDSHDHD